MIRAAAERLKGHARRTPLLSSPFLDEIAGRRVFVKAECLQHTGSFKYRGGRSALSALARGARRARAGGERCACGHVKKGGGTGHADGTRAQSVASFIARVSVHSRSRRTLCFMLYVCAYLPCQHLFFNIYVYGIYSL